MTKENCDKLVELQLEIEEQANTILSDFIRHGISILRIDNKDDLFHKLFDGITHVSYSGIDNDSIKYSGSTSWAYGGYEEYNFEFPLSYLFNDKWLEIETEKFNKMRADYLANQEKIKEEIKQKELAELAKLQAKYKE